jgi:hypothetical protein
MAETQKASEPTPAAGAPATPVTPPCRQGAVQAIAEPTSRTLSPKWRLKPTRSASRPEAKWQPR